MFFKGRFFQKGEGKRDACQDLDSDVRVPELSNVQFRQSADCFSTVSTTIAVALAD